MKFIALLTVLCILAGCSEPKEQGELQVMLSQALEAQVPAEFEICDFSTSVGIGDYAETYSFKFSSTAFASIELTVRGSSSWKKIPNSSVFQLVKEFEGHGFNWVISTLDTENQEISVEFGWE